MGFREQVCHCTHGQSHREFERPSLRRHLRSCAHSPVGSRSVQTVIVHLPRACGLALWSSSVCGHAAGSRRAKYCFMKAQKATSSATLSRKAFSTCRATTSTAHNRSALVVLWEPRRWLLASPARAQLRPPWLCLCWSSIGMMSCTCSAYACHGAVRVYTHISVLTRSLAVGVRRTTWRLLGGLSCDCCVKMRN